LGCCRVDDVDLFGCIDCWGLDEWTECVVGIVCFLVFENALQVLRARRRAAFRDEREAAESGQGVNRVSSIVMF
jgi:hypothetical protein